MATYKCQACGNLHGAPVETCGMCGASPVVLVPEQAAWAVDARGAGDADDLAPDTKPPKLDGFDRFAEILLHEVVPILKRKHELEELNVERTKELDETDNTRLQRETQAKVEFYGQATTLVEKLTELSESLITYVDTVLMHQPPPKASPIIE